MEWTDEVWKFTELNGREIMVSSYGRVIGFKGRIIKPQLMQTGYYVFKYWNGRHVANIEIHRLVAKAFIPNPENKPEVDHIDTVRTNNHVNNLRWVTCSENLRNPLTREKRSKALKGRVISDETRKLMSESHKGMRNGLGYRWTDEQKEKIKGRKPVPYKHTDETKSLLSELAKRRAKPIVVFDASGIYLQEFNSVREASMELNMPKEEIYRGISNDKKSRKGFIFKYKEDLL